MVLDKQIVFYTDNQLPDPICSVVRDQLAGYGIPIVSVSLKPIDFGTNYVVDLEPSYLTMVMQITRGLKESSARYVFFCEHDVLYPISHFDFVPERNDIFYYNDYVWRWEYPTDKAITYDRLFSLSSLCVNREFALDHYQKRLEAIKEKYLDRKQDGEPDWARKMGYEPGTKTKKRGGFSDDNFETWRSVYPIIDIRHKGTFSPPKTNLSGFKHPPENWRETNISMIPGWNLKRLFNLFS